MHYEKDKVAQGIYKTIDIDLVAALSLYHPIKKAERSRASNQRVIFSFEATDELMADVKSYRDREMAVEPQAYYFQLRNIRSQINDLKEIN